jgi:hypothetical protein
MHLLTHLPAACLTVPCRVFKYSFSKGASVGENIEFLRGMLAALAR